MQPFDFDYWTRLATHSPAEFEAQRRNALLAEVAKAPEGQRNKLTALVDDLCAPCDGSALEKTVAAHNRMMTSLVEQQTRMAELLQAVGAQAPDTRSAVSEYTTLQVRKP